MTPSEGKAQSPITELLAPAGSREGFIAALNAGADSVYAGVGDFNARRKASHLTLRDLARFTEHCHSRGKRFYAAFNILIKQNELTAAMSALQDLAGRGVDGVIVQDLGLARLVRRHFPQLALHASTQAACHNSAGVAELDALGFTRAVLARELSFAELSRIAASSRMELEVFCHGALCFSVSGMCLFSSAIGGHSGNRGLCAQPCRRRWKSGATDGFLFSPRDLELAAHVRDLKSIGIASLKIEGRMRSAEYVATATRAYRMLIDAPDDQWDETLVEAQRLLSGDWARAKTVFNFSGPAAAICDTTEAQCLGRRIGTIVAITGNSVTIETKETLAAGDRLRIADAQDDRTRSLTLAAFTQDGNRYSFELTGGRKGSAVFKAGDAAWDEKAVRREVDALYRQVEPKAASVRPEGILSFNVIRVAAPLKREKLWLCCEDPGWLNVAFSMRRDAQILARLNDNFLRVLEKQARLSLPPECFSCGLPAYIPEADLALWRDRIAALRRKGVRSWVIDNIGHIPLFGNRKDLELVAGPFLYVWNAVAASALQDAGVSRFFVPWESDAENINAAAAAGCASTMIVNLFGYPPLAATRMALKLRPGASISAADGFTMTLARDAGMLTLRPQVPFMLFGSRDKLASVGIKQFAIDLSGAAPNPGLLQTLLAAYEKKRRLSEIFRFNFERGVK